MDVLEKWKPGPGNRICRCAGAVVCMACELTGEIERQRGVIAALNGTDLYRRIVAFDHGSPEANDLTRKVWSPTPWVVNAYTGGGHPDPREREMLEWCFETFGDECSPIHERAGRWHRGSATVNGWTWFGFSTVTEMIYFLLRWGYAENPEGAGAP